MKINYFKDPFPYVIIDNTYSDLELNLIWDELNFISNSSIFSNSSDRYSGSAVKDGQILRNNISFWMDDFYSNRSYSNILNVNRVLFKEWDNIFGAHPSWMFKNFECTEDTTLISYYENGGYYKKHNDYSFFTSVTWFYKEPKRFSGGDLNLFLDDQIITIQVKNNSTVIFPSIIFHEVSKVIIDDQYRNKRMGRYCMVQFLKNR